MLLSIKDEMAEPINAGENASNPSYEENFQSVILVLTIVNWAGFIFHITT